MHVFELNFRGDGDTKRVIGAAHGQVFNSYIIEQALNVGVTLGNRTVGLWHEPMFSQSLGSHLSRVRSVELGLSQLASIKSNTGSPIYLIQLFLLL